MLWRESQAWSSTLTTFSQDRPDLNLGLKTGGEWEITHSDLFLVPFLPLVLKLGGVTGEGEFRMLSQYWGDSLFLLVVQHDCWSSLSGGCSSSSLLLTVSASLPHFHRHWQSLARFVYIFWFILTDGIHTIWLICMSFFFFGLKTWPNQICLPWQVLGPAGACGGGLHFSYPLVPENSGWVTVLLPVWTSPPHSLPSSLFLCACNGGADQ